MARTKRQVKKHKRRMSNPQLSPTEQARRVFARKRTLPPSSMDPLGTSAAAMAMPLIIRQSVARRQEEIPTFDTKISYTDGEAFVVMDESVRNPEGAPPEAGEESK